MICSKCNGKIDVKFEFCPTCGSRLVESKVGKTSNIGNVTGQNVLIGVGNDNITNVNIHNKIDDDTSIEYVDHVIAKRNTNLTLWENIAKVATVVSALIAVFSYFGVDKMLGGGVALLTLLLFTWFDHIHNLKKNKRSSMNSIGTYKTIDENDAVNTIIKQANCSKCSGKVLPREIKIDNNSKTYGFCSNHPYDHIFSFKANIKTGKLLGEIEKIKIFNEFESRKNA